MPKRLARCFVRREILQSISALIISPNRFTSRTLIAPISGPALAFFPILTRCAMLSPPEKKRAQRIGPSEKSGAFAQGKSSRIEQFFKWQHLGFCIILMHQIPRSTRSYTPRHQPPRFPFIFRFSARSATSLIAFSFIFTAFCRCCSLVVRIQTNLISVLQLFRFTRRVVPRLEHDSWAP